jgi:hypothetical protein
MDFLECPSCEARYLVPDDEGGNAWNCWRCGDEIRLVAWHMPGDAEELSQALNAAPAYPDRQMHGPDELA